MGQVKRRRRYPTVVNRGLGLLEVILPRGGSDDPACTVPPGQRDESGFWFPVGYTRPGDIFTAQQRRLQEKQRAIQKERRLRPPEPAQDGRPLEVGAPPPHAEVEAVPHQAFGATMIAPGSPAADLAGDVPVPLPPACLDGAIPLPVLQVRRGPRLDPAIFAASDVASASAAPRPAGRRVDSAKPSE